jgi:nucleoid DNA-binding protein
MSELEALAAAIVSGGKASLPGLGTFHLRDRGRRGRGVLFVLDDAGRDALHGGPAAGSPLVKEIWRELKAGRAWEDASLGTLRAVITTPKTFSDPKSGKVDVIAPRPAIAFTPSQALLARL